MSGPKKNKNINTLCTIYYNIYSIFFFVFFFLKLDEIVECWLFLVMSHETTKYRCLKIYLFYLGFVPNTQIGFNVGHSLQLVTQQTNIFL